VYQFLEQLGSQRKHAFLHHGVRLAHALKQLQRRVDTLHELVKVLMEILFVASYTSHPAPWPCRVTPRLPHPRDEPSVQIGILSPTTISVAQHLNGCVVGLDQPANAHSGTTRPDACTNCLMAGCFYRSMLRKGAWRRHGRLSAARAPRGIPTNELPTLRPFLSCCRQARTRAI